MKAKVLFFYKNFLRKGDLIKNKNSDNLVGEVYLQHIFMVKRLKKIARNLIVCKFKKVTKDVHDK